MSDLISREAVIALINASISDLEYADENIAMQEAIKMLPTIEVEQTVLELSNLLAEKDKIIKDLSQIRTDIEAEPTFEQIEEYCRKRCLVVVDVALFNEMKSRWSAEPRKHGRWEKKGISIKGIEKEFCSECKTWSYGRNKAYCPNCGAKMQSTMGQVKHGRRSGGRK